MENKRNNNKKQSSFLRKLLLCVPALCVIAVVATFYMIFDMNNIKKFYNNKSTISFIAKTNNKIVGFAYGYDIIHPNGKHAYFLYSIGMLPDYQDKGYGTKLLSFIKDYISNNGYFEMFVLTDKGNPRACHVYEKLGGKNDYDDEICYVYDFEGDK